MTAPILTVYPGAGVPPSGHDELRVPPAQMKTGDRLLLGGRIRTVRHAKRDGRRPAAVLLDAADGGPNVEEWVPETGDLPLPIWRPSRNAARERAAITSGRSTATRHLVVAASLASEPDLGPRIVRGLGSIPTTRDNRGTHGEARAQFPAFQRTRPEPDQAPALAASPSHIAQLYAAIATIRGSGQSDQF
ncbi:hypothetical protein KGQ19_15930 [Catenulispora sp. NL8]|uniref:Uncharacterized protein n=1 Tax=Catenulispora pinistramenti TaxID=2705254 RepID=A0ABS5KQR3_9ACTN|nr:hypothetical protein [Catenulispora pinistramenti]MBS2548355.1 hypothetical protein [Catenulispora pinistramenti]